MTSFALPRSSGEEIHPPQRIVPISTQSRLSLSCYMFAPCSGRSVLCKKGAKKAIRDSLYGAILSDAVFSAKAIQGYLNLVLTQFVFLKATLRVSRHCSLFFPAPILRRRASKPILECDSSRSPLDRAQEIGPRQVNRQQKDARWPHPVGNHLVYCSPRPPEPHGLLHHGIVAKVIHGFSTDLEKIKINAEKQEDVVSRVLSRCHAAVWKVSSLVVAIVAISGLVEEKKRLCRRIEA